MKTDTNERKVILFYNTMWGAPLPLPQEGIPEGVLLTTDRRYLKTADAVVFHIPDLYKAMDDDLEKPEGQKWVAWSLESEENYPLLRNREFMSLFDYTMTYRQHADIVQAYYRYDYPERLLQTAGVPFREKKDVCMMISSPCNRSRRHEYLCELMRHIPIDSYGKLFHNCTLEQDRGRESKLELYRQYKFVIAFENSCGTDYVTEKFYDPMLSGAVPVYFGASNIEEFTPGDNCFVDVRQFTSPESLAAFLTEACKDECHYNRFQAWRTRPLNPVFLQNASMQREHPFIRLCRLIRTIEK